jgi:hypothetical protein
MYLCVLTKALALIELMQYPFVVFAGCLVGAGDGIKAHRLPHINEAMILQCLPFGASASNRICVPLAGGGTGLNINHIDVLYRFIVLLIHGATSTIIDNLMQYILFKTHKPVDTHWTTNLQRC